MRKLITTTMMALALGGAATPAKAGPSMIEVGGGAAFLNDGQPIDAFFHVEALSASGVKKDYFIRAHIDATAAVGGEGLGYLDIHLNSLGSNRGIDEMFGSLTYLNADVQRNVAIGNQLGLRVTLIGVQGQLSSDLSETVTLVLKGAADLIGLGYTLRADGADLLGAGSGASAEAALKFNKRFRIALGEKLGITSGKGIQVRDGVDCTTYRDDWGNTYTTCRDHYSTVYRDHRVTSNTYLSLAFDLTENLKVFGQASYSVYAVSDATGEDQTSVKGAFQFFLGVGGTF